MLKSFKNNAAYDFGGACSFFLGEVIVLLVCQGLASVIATVAEIAGQSIAANGDFNTAFMIFIQLAVVGYAFAFSKARKKKFNFVYINDESGKAPRVADFVVPIFAAAIIMAGMFLPATWYGYFTQAIGIPPDFGEIELNTVSSIVMMVIATTICAPIVEETVYRGVLFHGLKSKQSVVKAALLSALAFMMMHMNPLQVVYQFALGVLAAFIVYRSGKLISSIILHAVSNALALVMSMTPFGGVLAGCEMWLTQNIAAAVFITLGLFVGGGLALFLLVRFCYDFRGTVEMFKKLFAGKKPAKTAANGAPVENPDSTEQPNHAIADNTEKAATEKPAPKFCPHCGKMLDGRFCGGCGYDSNNIGNQQAETKALLAKYADGNAKVKYWIGVGVCAVMFVLTLVTAIASGFLPS